MIQNTLGTFGSQFVHADQLFGDTSSPDAAAGSGSNAPSFADTLTNAISSVNTLQTNAAQASTAFALGQVSDIHTVMIAAQKASIAMSLTTEIRNKVVDAYQSVMQTSM